MSDRVADPQGLREQVIDHAAYARKNGAVMLDHHFLDRVVAALAASEPAATVTERLKKDAEWMKQEAAPRLEKMGFVIVARSEWDRIIPEILLREPAAQPEGTTREKPVSEMTDAEVDAGIARETQRIIDHMSGKAQIDPTGVRWGATAPEAVRGSGPIWPRMVNESTSAPEWMVERLRRNTTNAAEPPVAQPAPASLSVPTPEVLRRFGSWFDTSIEGQKIELRMTFESRLYGHYRATGDYSIGGIFRMLADALAEAAPSAGGGDG